jgi:hypothetical protein
VGETTPNLKSIFIWTEILSIMSRMYWVIISKDRREERNTTWSRGKEY